jgi:putative acetyltransferase
MMNLALQVENQPAIRPVRDGDAQDLYGLIAICYADYPGCFVDPHDDLPDLRAPSTSYDRTGGAFWAVEDERGRVCACVAVDFPESETAELHRLYVRPDQRGRGLGSRLVHQAEAHARSKGASRIVLWSDTRFVTAHRLYTRLGYVKAQGQRQLADISQSVEYGFEKRL